jgi:hypothetical protein
VEMDSAIDSSWAKRGWVFSRRKMCVEVPGVHAITKGIGVCVCRGSKSESKGEGEGK